MKIFNQEQEKEIPEIQEGETPKEDEEKEI